MDANGEEDFSKLPVLDRLQHKVRTPSLSSPYFFTTTDPILDLTIVSVLALESSVVCL